MKKLALVLFAGISFATAHAQVQFGVKAGANFATQTGSDAGDNKTLFNFNAGAFLKLPVVPGFAVQPELVYSGQGAGYDVNGNTINYHANYLNIPILFKWSHRSGPYFETGPQIGFIMSAHVKSGGTSVSDKEAYKSSDFAWVFGVGYKIPRSPVGIDLRYNIGLSNVEDRDVTGLNGSIRNDVLQLGLTYVLFNGPRR
ncbi:MAG TPA: porin family protein [Puia sp.]|jgi:hypothetical protein